MPVKDYVYYHAMIFVFKIYHKLVPDYSGKKIKFIENDDQHTRTNRTRHHK